MVAQQVEVTLATILPPVFLLSIIFLIWSIHICLHLIPLYFEARTEGIIHAIISQGFALMLGICYSLSAFSCPGLVPDSMDWKLGFGAKADLPMMLEVKYSTGERRRCKRCMAYKPDRCHHCRVCKTCILRMDHHCPWIMNCIGFRNHKYFFLLVMYSVLTCAYIGATMAQTVHKSLEQDLPSYHRFMLVLCTMLAIIMGGLMFTFMLFHVWLTLTATTTIEFCEKSTGYDEQTGTIRTRRGSRYDLGYWENLKAVLGPQPLLWFLPVSLPVGDGHSFAQIKDVPAIEEQSGVREPEWTSRRSP